MEHFEVHKEQLEDLVIDLNEKGPALFDGVKSNYITTRRNPTMDDFALIDEVSGLNDFLRNHMKNTAMSETQKQRIRSHMIEYKGPKDKNVALNEISMTIFGDGR